MDEIFMKRAVELVERSIDDGQTPFGSVIVKGKEIISEAHNTVWLDCDPTAHAEVNAIRKAARKLGTISLNGCTLYSSCEPCPMCLSAIHWAKIDRVVYGATIPDAAKAGFSELHLPAKELALRGASHLKVEQGPLQEECRLLFDKWLAAGKARKY